MRSAVQDTCREQRHQDGVRHPHHRYQRQQREDRTYRHKAGSIAPPFAQLLQNIPPRAALLSCEVFHRQQRRNYRQVTEAVNQEAPAFAGDRNHRAGNRWTDQTRRIDHGRVQRDGIGQVLAVFHHLDDKGLPRRHIESVDRPLKHTEQDDVDDGNAMAQRQRRQAEGLNHRQRLRDHQHAMAIPAIDPDTRERPQQQHGDLAGEAHQTEQECRTCEPIDEPCRRNPRHPCADQRGRLAGEEQRVIAMAQRPDGEFPVGPARGALACGWLGHGWHSRCEAMWIAFVLVDLLLPAQLSNWMRAD